MFCWACWAALLAVYFLAGGVIGLILVHIYKPSPPDFDLGLTVIFWPLILLWDVFVQLGRGIGRTVRRTTKKD